MATYDVEVPGTWVRGATSAYDYDQYRRRVRNVLRRLYGSEVSIEVVGEPNERAKKRLAAERNRREHSVFYGRVELEGVPVKYEGTFTVRVAVNARNQADALEQAKAHPVWDLLSRGGSSSSVGWCKAPQLTPIWE
jgi:hypothetical protein